MQELEKAEEDVVLDEVADFEVAGSGFDEGAADAEEIVDQTGWDEDGFAAVDELL